ncbi:MAG: hypothetical protein U1B30_16480 [Pseudomonadota bacterium]|nr:hypothetical protein [Pseudomonadota bacterium]
MSQYHKAIAAAVGFLAVILKDQLGIELPEKWADAVVEGIMAVGTVVWVVAGKNAK